MAGWHRFDFWLRPAVLLAVVLVVALWERRPSQDVEAPRSPAIQQPAIQGTPAVEERPQAVAQCARKSGAEFRKAWSEGTVSTDAWAETAEYVSHYNPKLESCFYLLTIARRLPPSFEDIGPVVLVRQMLFDVNEGELYGEYRGPEAGGAPGVGLPETCRVTAFYCASRGEWERLAGMFMESGAQTP